LPRGDPQNCRVGIQADNRNVLVALLERICHRAGTVTGAQHRRTAENVRKLQ
jgi:hypothetical protein